MGDRNKKNMHKTLLPTWNREKENIFANINLFYYKFSTIKKRVVLLFAHIYTNLIHFILVALINLFRFMFTCVGNHLNFSKLFCVLRNHIHIYFFVIFRNSTFEWKKRSIFFRYSPHAWKWSAQLVKSIESLVIHQK